MKPVRGEKEEEEEELGVCGGGSPERQPRPVGVPMWLLRRLVVGYQPLAVRNTAQAATLKLKKAALLGAVLGTAPSTTVSVLLM